jgi:uncharacterized iron-regulated membrane protein
MSENGSGQPTAWQRWVRRPQRVWIRRAVFQVHLWSGVALGVYIFFISVTGSVLVYRNELFVLTTPEAGVLHDNLLAGSLGRRVNGVGAVAVLLVAMTGLFIWWPGIDRWRRSLILHRGVGWRRFAWDLHSAAGFWSFAFIAVFAASGVYLCFPAMFHGFADWLVPPTLENAGNRLVDDVLYWLAFLHFGRINGIGIPCSGPGLCDQITKAAWATLGLAPAIMFMTGALMWWNRVVRRWLRKTGIL